MACGHDVALANELCDAVLELSIGELIGQPDYVALALVKVQIERNVGDDLLVPNPIIENRNMLEIQQLKILQRLVP